MEIEHILSKKAYSYGQKELAIPILSLNPTIKLNEEKPHKQRIMQKFDKPVKEYHKISEEFPRFPNRWKAGNSSALINAFSLNRL